MARNFRPENQYQYHGYVDAGKATTTGRILYYMLKCKINWNSEGASQMDWMGDKADYHIICCRQQLNGITTPTSSTHQDTWTSQSKYSNSLRCIRTVRLLLLRLTIRCWPQTETVWRQATEVRVYVSCCQQNGQNRYWLPLLIKHTSRPSSSKRTPINCQIGAEDDFSYEYRRAWVRWKLKSIQRQVQISLKKIFSWIPWPSSRIPWKVVERLWLVNDGEIPWKKVKEITNERLKTAIVNSYQRWILGIVWFTSFKNKGVQWCLMRLSRLPSSPLDIPAIKGIKSR